jgi:tetratricopeptide (TPR) repeat protein
LAAQAIPLLKEALSANPNVAEAHGELGYAYRYGGMLPESLAECESALERRGTIRPRFRSTVLRKPRSGCATNTTG